MLPAGANDHGGADEIIRSACAKVRRLGASPVMRGLLAGSTSASASGCRDRTRLNSVSRVGEAVGWVTASLQCNHFGCGSGLYHQVSGR